MWSEHLQEWVGLVRVSEGVRGSGKGFCRSGWGGNYICRSG